MPKTPSNKLFRLIKSLSGSEKRYFKIFARNKNDKTNKYIQLFDAIDSQEVFDEEALKQVIYKGEKIQSRKYSELKAYLYDLILKGLQAYDEKNSIDYRLKNMMLGVRALYRRTHFEDCWELLYKAKKLADKYEDFKVLLEILTWEKEVAYAQTNIGYLDKELKRINKEEKWLLKQLANSTTYRNIFFELLVNIRKGATFRARDKKAAFDKIINHPLMKEAEMPQSYTSKVLYYRILSIYAYATMDKYKFYSYGRKLLEVMESKPYMLKEDVSEYISALSNFITSCSILKHYEAMRNNLEKFKQIQAKTADDELKIHRQYYLSKFEMCNRTGEFEEGLLALNEHFKSMKKFDQQFFQSSSFYFNYFCIYFGVGEYNQALHYLNEWRNLPKSTERQELQSLARVLNLLIHFELNNTLLLEGLLRSSYRFLKKQKQIYQFENLMLDFVRDVIKIKSNRELKPIFLRLKSNFELLNQDPIEKAMLQYFDIVAWLESKISKRSFGDIIREKYSNSLKNSKL